MTTTAPHHLVNDDHSQTAGHVFVIHGSLEDVTCDAVVIPTDTSFGVRRHWSDVTGPAAPVKPARWAEDHFGRAAQETTTAAWYIDVTDRDHAAPPELIAGRVRAAVEAISRSFRTPWLSPVRGRAQHLVALPLLGTGGGGVASTDMVVALLSALGEVVRDLRIDVAIVVPKRSHFNALQWQRRRYLGASVDDTMRRLGEMARRGELALMLGAGVSAGAGLPNWAGLIKHVAARADRQDIRDLVNTDAFDNLPMLDQAELIARLLGDRAPAAIVDAVTVAPRTDSGSDGEGPDYTPEPVKPALSHFLLAGLRCREVATTNYDLLYERAVKSQTDGSLKVAALPYDVVAPNASWILKLHGDAEHPKDIVLSRSAFVDYDGSRQALGALFQAMLMTRHVLFVGVSFTDDNVLRLTHHVTKSRKGILGTALALETDLARKRLWEDTVTWIGMEVPEDIEADKEARTAWQARSIEVYLDQVAMWAVSESEVLLDKEILDDSANPLGLDDEQLTATTAGRLWTSYISSTE